MKLIFSSILIFSLLFSILANINIVIEYNFNKESFVELFCINKSNKSCSGKCMLMKSFDLEDRGNDDQKTISFLESLKFIVDIELITIFKTNAFNSLNFNFQQAQFITFISEFLKPPESFYVNSTH